MNEKLKTETLYWKYYLLYIALEYKLDLFWNHTW